MLCEYFRQGKCTKGFKCKYSHDLDVERKGGKIDLFTDQCAPFFNSVTPFSSKCKKHRRAGGLADQCMPLVPLPECCWVEHVVT